MRDACVTLRYACNLFNRVYLPACIDSLVHTDPSPRPPPSPSLGEFDSSFKQCQGAVAGALPSPCPCVQLHCNGVTRLLDCDTFAGLQRTSRRYCSMRCRWLILPCKRSKKHRICARPSWLLVVLRLLLMVMMMALESRS